MKFRRPGPAAGITGCSPVAAALSYFDWSCVLLYVWMHCWFKLEEEEGENNTIPTRSIKFSYWHQTLKLDCLEIENNFAIYNKWVVHGVSCWIVFLKKVDKQKGYSKEIAIMPVFFLNKSFKLSSTFKYLTSISTQKNTMSCCQNNFFI